MNDKQRLLCRRLTSADFGPEPAAALDYLQLRNLEALRAWRARYVASRHPSRVDPQPATHALNPCSRTAEESSSWHR
jgi:hypothetical protein